MGKRIAVKTTLICLGIFLIMSAIATALVLKKYPLDMEKHISVVIAAVDLEPGTEIELRHIKTKQLQQSAANSTMPTDLSLVVGRKATCKIIKGDYIRSSDLLQKEAWFREDERIIILPVNMEERLANLIVKGSYIDIRLKREMSPMVETVLSKVKVADMLDENGTPIGSKAGINSRTAYMKLILNNNDRQKVYTAKTEGKLIFELYCNELQKGN